MQGPTNDRFFAGLAKVLLAFSCSTEGEHAQREANLTDILPADARPAAALTPTPAAGQLSLFPSPTNIPPLDGAWARRRA